MKKKEQEEYLNNLGFEIKNIPEDWLLKRIKFSEPHKKTQQHRTRFFKNVLYVHKNIPFIMQITYSWNEDFTKWVILNQDVISAHFNGYIFTNIYYIMGWGYKPNYEYNFKRRIKLNYCFYESIYYDYVYKGKNYTRHIDNIQDVNRPLFETMYKEKIHHLNCFVKNSTSNKPYVALGLVKYMNKDKFKEFIEWVRRFRKFDIILYEDFLKLAKNRNHKDIFVDNWLELHDQWAGIVEQRRNETLANKDIKVWNKDVKQSDIYIKKMESNEEKLKFGNEMNNCLTGDLFDYKKIYRIESYITETPLALHWEDNEIQQLYGYKNQSVSDKVERLVKNVMIKYIKKHKDGV